MPNVIEFPSKPSSDFRSKHRLMVYRLFAKMLQAEEQGEFWKADALFVQLGMFDKRKANAAVAAAKICSMAARKP